MFFLLTKPHWIFFSQPVAVLPWPWDRRSRREVKNPYGAPPSGQVLMFPDDQLLGRLPKLGKLMKKMGKRCHWWVPGFTLFGGSNFSGRHWRMCPMNPTAILVEGIEGNFTWFQFPWTQRLLYLQKNFAHCAWDMIWSENGIIPNCP